MKQISIIIVAIVIIGGLFYAMSIAEDPEPAPEITMEEAQEIASDWMENQAPTYVFDGSELNLQDSREISEGQYEFTFSFQSAAAGYGDRSDEMAAQVITDHTTVVTVENGEVVEAITDEVYSEFRDEMLDENGEVDEMTVSVYFIMVDDGQEDLTAVERVVDASAPARGALEELLAGITAEEEGEGLTTAINEGVVINELTIEDGVARVDFSSELNEGVAGSATVMAIRDQIEATLLQFDTVDEVVISIEGESEKILQP